MNNKSTQTCQLGFRTYCVICIVFIFPIGSKHRAKICDENQTRCIEWNPCHVLSVMCMVCIYCCDHAMYWYLKKFNDWSMLLCSLFCKFLSNLITNISLITHFPDQFLVSTDYKKKTELKNYEKKFDSRFYLYILGKSINIDKFN